MTSKQKTANPAPIKRKKRVLNPKKAPEPTPRKKRSLLGSLNSTLPSGSSSTSPPASVPANSKMPIIPLPSFPDSQLSTSLPSQINLTVESAASNNTESIPPATKIANRRSILTLQQKPDKGNSKRKRKLLSAPVGLEDVSDEEDLAMKRLESHLLPGPVTVGAPSCRRRKKKKKENEVANQGEPKRKSKKEPGVRLDLSHHSILPNASYVAHLPKKRLSLSTEDQFLSDDASEVFADASSQPDSVQTYFTDESQRTPLSFASAQLSEPEIELELPPVDSMCISEGESGDERQNTLLRWPSKASVVEPRAEETPRLEPQHHSFWRSFWNPFKKST
ncbi:hypothetical protein BY458DRAFT_205756 [Sporodiniella umbellata]|nr:hypothetical protein BY458DRAFT_205756 [Sporodiniella umbellata]